MNIRLNYLVIPLLALISASAASYFAETGRMFYTTIHMPFWIPANSFMVITSIIIFLLTAVSVLIVWNKYPQQKNFKLIIGLYILSAIINVGWNILLFNQQEIVLAFFKQYF